MTHSTHTLARQVALRSASLILVGCCCLGCEPNGQGPTGTRATPAPAPDNTANNDKVRDGVQSTPMDQSQSSSDVAITAEVRRLLMDDETLSSNAKNCKVITSAGAVTLEGVVDSEAEKRAVEDHAKSVRGVGSVLNRLEPKV